MFLIPLVVLLGGAIWLATAKAVNQPQAQQPTIPPFPPAQPILSAADQANAASLGLTPQEYVAGGLVGTGSSVSGAAGYGVTFYDPMSGKGYR